MKHFKVATIIPTINEAVGIELAIRRARESGADEVIVVDGGSDDDTCQIVKRVQCQLIHSPPGRACQQNLGATQADADVLLFMHADNWLAHGAVAQMRQALRNPRVAAGSFCQRIEAEGKIYRWLERGNDFRAKRLKLPYGDQGIFIRRDLFQKIGGFPVVQLMEEIALIKKVRQHTRLIQLPGPIHVSARRWQKHGVIPQTIRNWSLLVAYQLGVPPDRLARFYPRHR